MEPFEESGLRFTPPGPICFRFADCSTYRRLSGQAVSEMDICWWDAAKELLVLLELKDYSVHTTSRELVPKLVAKGRDCLVMLHAAWNELGDLAKNLRIELPQGCREKRVVRLYFMLKVGDGLTREALAPMKDKLEADIKAYAALLGIWPLRVFLLDHHTAIRHHLPLTIV
jgi:hypothetical protein